MKIHSDRTTETGNLLVGYCWIKVCFLCIISLLLENNLIRLILPRVQIQGLFAKVLLFTVNHTQTGMLVSVMLLKSCLDIQSGLPRLLGVLSM